MNDDVTTRCVIGHWQTVNDARVPDPQPRAAHREGALLCVGHYGALRREVAGLPALVAHLREQVEPGSGPAVDTKITGTSEHGRAPLNLAAVDAADDRVQVLASWAALVAEEHPDGTRPPVLTGAAWAHAYGAEKVLRHGSRRGGAEVLRGVSPSGTGGITALARWLYDRLDWLSAHPAVDEAFSELVRDAGTIRHRWPMEPTETDLTVPCPSCERMTLVMAPPGAEGWPVTVRCTHRDCGAVIPEQQYAFWVELVKHERRTA